MYTFNGEIRAGSILFVHTTWCRYSREAVPIMKEVSKYLGHAVPVYDVDGDMWKSYLKTKGIEVKSFPTIVYVGGDGTVEIFDDERSVDGIVAWTCHKARKQQGTIQAGDAF